MGLITGLLTAPLLPLRGTVAIAEQILEQAEEQYYDPARIRRQLEDIDKARETGALSEVEAADMEDELVQRLMHRRT